MRARIIAAFAVVSLPALGQSTLPTTTYYSPNPANEVCSGGRGAKCSLVECDAIGRCACVIALPNGWKQPLTEAQCASASRSLPLLPPEEQQRRDSKAAGGNPSASDHKERREPSPAPVSGAATRSPDDQDLCRPKGSGGAGTSKSPTTCRYTCGPVEVCVELDPPATVCPGDEGPLTPTRWKTLKNLRKCKS